MIFFKEKTYHENFCIFKNGYTIDYLLIKNFRPEILNIKISKNGILLCMQSCLYFNMVGKYKIMSINKPHKIENMADWYLILKGMEKYFGIIF